MAMIRRAVHRCSPLVAVALCAVALLGGRGVLPAAGQDLTAQLPLRYFHQYLGNPSDNYDCGPASVAMVLSAFGTRPTGMTDAALVWAVRRTMGLPPAVGTWYDDLERVFSAVGLRTWRVPDGLPGRPDAELRLMEQAVAGGAPVIAMVHGATLGRGARYEDHWVVVVGFSATAVHLFDPDDQRPRSADWVVGGDIALPLDLFARAMREARPGPYGLVVFPPPHVPAPVGKPQSATSHADGGTEQTTGGPSGWVKHTIAP